MAFASTDLITVGRQGSVGSGVNYRETYGNKSNIENDDVLMVEATTTAGGREIGTRYKCERDDWDGSGGGSTPVAEDLLLVERPSVTLSMTASLGAEELLVSAIPAALSSGTTLVFDGSAGNAAFTLTSSASAGAEILYGTGGLKGSAVDNYTTGGVLYKATKTDWDGTPSYVDIHSANYAINPITTLYDEGNNSQNAWSVVEVQAEFTSSASFADGNLYIGFRNTAQTTWQGDLPIAAVQILESDGTTVRETDNHNCTWNFALGNIAPTSPSTIAGGYRDWATTRYQDNKSTISSMDYDPADAEGGYYACTYVDSEWIYCIDESRTKWRFSSTDIGTSSNHVGARRGISSTTYNGTPSGSGATSILPVGSANISQSNDSDDGYLFSECSSTTRYDVTWLLLAYTGDLYNGDRIRICYYGGGNGLTSTSGLKTNNSLWIRFKEEE